MAYYPSAFERRHPEQTIAESDKVIIARLEELETATRRELEQLKPNRWFCIQCKDDLFQVDEPSDKGPCSGPERGDDYRTHNFRPFFYDIPLR